MPLFIAVVLTVLVIRLKSFERVVVVVQIAPLGLIGGLIVATALTLLFLPAPYAAWFRVRAPTG